jgi:hypothetical protein
MKTQLEHYIEALIPKQFVVLGVKLLPYCLGHFFLMKKYKCGFAEEDENVFGDFIDILSAVAICSRTYEEGLLYCQELDDYGNGKLSTKPESVKWNEQWAKQIRKALKKYGKEYNIFEEVSKIKSYMRHGIVVPKFYNNTQNNNTPSGAHWTTNVLNTLVSECNYNQSEAMNVSLARGLVDYFKHAEKNGNGDFMQDWEIEQEDKLLQQQEQQDQKGNSLNGK